LIKCLWGGAPVAHLFFWVSSVAIWRRLPFLVGWLLSFLMQKNN
jgi:hypothetical protein